MIRARILFYSLFSSFFLMSKTSDLSMMVRTASKVMTDRRTMTRKSVQHVVNEQQNVLDPLTEVDIVIIFL